MPKTRCLLVITAIAASWSCRAAEPAPELDAAKLEADNVAVGEIILDKHDVFDLSNPKENNWLFRLANKWHIVTKDEIITRQLLLEPGDLYSQRLVDESARILRRNIYLYDASVKPVNREDGKVDLLVTTDDVWTLHPGFSFSRKGGENKTAINLEESNLLGRGQQIRFSRSDDVNRVSKSVEFIDKQLGDSWVALNAFYSDNSDGKFSYLSIARNFYALDARWAAGTRMSSIDQRVFIYDLGEQAAEYQQERQYFNTFGGWSAGLHNGWVRRYTAGIVYDDNRFSNVVDATLPPAIPADRKLVYPFLGVEILQDSFEETTNRDQIQRTEDLRTGLRVAASIGWSDTALGADRNALVYNASASRLLGSLDHVALDLSGAASGRLEGGTTANALLDLQARYSHRFSEKNTFFATFSTTMGHELDLDDPVILGGETGLRGYPLGYQSGDSKLLLSIEQRYFWDWYPLRLFRLGGALFADMGRTWGPHPVGGSELGWLRDVGFGLRLAPTRTGSGKVIHIDIAFPLDGDPSVDDVQILVESKKSF